MNKNRVNTFKYERISSEIKKELQTLFATEIKDKRIKHQVNITDCIVSKDLSLCKVYVMSLQDDKQQLLKALDSCRGFLRTNVANSLNLRKTPDFKFYIDETFDNMNHIEELLNKIKNESVEK